MCLMFFHSYIFSQVFNSINAIYKIECRLTYSENICTNTFAHQNFLSF